MNDFKKRIQARQFLLISGALVACSAVLLSRNYEKVPSVPDSVSDFVRGFQAGVVIGLIGFMAFYFF